jgi:RNA polymerase primary sigma factor
MRGRRTVTTDRQRAVDDIYYRDLARCEPMTAERERTLCEELVALAKARGSARADERKHLDRRVAALHDQFVRANLRLVVKIAAQYQQGKIPLSDLVQEGNLGLITAIERFDPARGVRFCTYAAWWIRHRISRAKANHGRAVRVPTHLAQTASKLAHRRRTFEATEHRTPSLEELAELVGVAPHRARLALDATAPFVSLETPFDEADDRTLGDLLADPSEPADESIADERRRQEIARALATLPPLEAEILRRRFTFDGDDAPTLRELGREHALSRERIRQLQNRALGRLREQLAHRAGEAA